MKSRVELAKDEILRILAVCPSEEIEADRDMLDIYLKQQDAALALGDSVPTIDGAKFGGAIELPAMVHLVTAALLTVHAALELKKSRANEEALVAIRETLANRLTSAGVSEVEATKISDELGNGGV